ncbi:Subtilase-like protein [Zostera marina]|uniref:Subtilase-like protein n=1 Tax=Zostera marina TaxID=29655 RepID=A0A0K9NSF1_ZOSMR|nr:Subtilase-like protein [Zostera marina]
MAQKGTSTVGAGDEEARVHIVYTQPPEEEPEAYHVRTLTSVLGSEEAAREALIYSYSAAANGFSAKLTPKQVVDISNQPGVLQVTPSQNLQLH